MKTGNSKEITEKIYREIDKIYTYTNYTGEDDTYGTKDRAYALHRYPGGQAGLPLQPVRRRGVLARTVLSAVSG